MNIGITIQLKENTSLFVNGINQNVLMLYDILNEIEFVNNVFLVNTQTNLSDEQIQSLTWLDNYKVHSWSHETGDVIDVLITLGSTPQDQDLLLFKHKKRGNKLIGYKGGNSFVLHMEELLHLGRTPGEKQIKNPMVKSTLFDEIWMVPQQEFHNKDFFEIQNKTKAKSVPFVWSPKFIEMDAQIITKNEQATPYFDDKVFDKYRATSMEPNTSVLKNLLPILYIYEHAYGLNQNLFSKFHITNANHHMENPFLLHAVAGLDIQKNKMIAFDVRRSVVNLLSFFSEMVVSHQWGNPLNYAYFDVVYFGHPLIHNANLCQDIGYYYEGFKLKDGAKLMIQAAEERKSDTHYTQRHRNILKRYTVNNKEMIEQYGMLLKNLYDLNDIHNKQYNWKTNLLE